MNNIDNNKGRKDIETIERVYWQGRFPLADGKIFITFQCLPDRYLRYKPKLERYMYLNSYVEQQL